MREQPHNMPGQCHMPTYCSERFRTQTTDVPLSLTNSGGLLQGSIDIGGGSFEHVTGPVAGSVAAGHIFGDSTSQNRDGVMMPRHRLAGAMTVLLIAVGGW